MSSVPRSNTVSPTATSPPARRTCSPSWAPSTVTWSPAVAVRSTITTASAPSGIGAPVMMRIASPGPTGIVGAAPGGQLTDDARTGRRACVGGPHRVAVHTCVRERRNRFGRDDVFARARDRTRRRAHAGAATAVRPRRRMNRCASESGITRVYTTLLHVLAQPFGELRAEIGSVECQLDVRAEEVELLADVVAAGVADVAVDRLRLEKQHHRVGELQLAPASGFDAIERVEDVGAEHVAPDDRQVRRRFRDATASRPCAAPRQRRRRRFAVGFDATVRRDLVGLDFL